MCDQTEIPYKNGDIVWVKLGNVFWPGQVVDLDSIDEDISSSFKKKPIAAVQFFGEDKYEFVKSLDHISLYNGRRKNDFLKKGIEQFRKQKDGVSFMNKFPDDVKRAEELTGGNPHILKEPEFLPQEKQSYRALFDGNKSVDSKKGGKRGRPPSTPKTNGRRSVAPTPPAKTPLRPITHPRFVKGETDHDVRIRQQGADDSPTKEDSARKDMPYKCTQCDFTASRLNVIVLHNKFHSDADSSSKAKGKSGKKPGRPRASLTPAPRPKPVVERTKPVETESPVATDSPGTEAPTRGSKRAVKRKIWADEELAPTPPRKAGRPPKKTPVSPTKDKRKKPFEELDKSPEPVDKKPKTPEKVKITEKSPEKKSPGKRKSQAVDEKVAAKKSKDDEEIREQLLADWDDEDAEQEQQELEQLKKKPAEPADAAKEASCFDFDDAKDAILDSELEKRAKKFVESRKTPRVERLVAEDDETETKDMGDAVESLLADTAVPQLPQVPETKLPDVVLDSSMAEEARVTVVTSMDFGGGDHDYSARLSGPADLLDIDSMPVVMTEDIASEIDVASSVESQGLVFSEADMKMTQSVKSVVKAVRSAPSKAAAKTLAPVPVLARPPTLTQVAKLPEGVKKVTPIRTAVSTAKGIAGGKYIIVQSPSGQQSRLTIAPADTPGTSHKVQSVGGGKVVILTKPQGGQKVLTAVSPAQQKALKTQRIVSATGQILTPVSGRAPIPPGTKITPITGNQMRVMTATGIRNAAAPKIQMQSLQTKVVLPSMAKMAPKKVALPTAPRPAMTSGVHARAAAQLNQLTGPRLLKSAAVPGQAARPAFTPKILQQHRPAFQPRMLAQKPRATATTVGVAKVGGTEGAAISTQPQAAVKVGQSQAKPGGQVMKIIPQPKRVTQPPTIQRVALTQPKPAARQKTFTITAPRTTAPPTVVTTVAAPSQEPPPLTPFSAPLPLPAMSLADSSSGFVTDAGNTVLTADQLAQLTSTSTAALGDGATYVLLTIDEAGNLLPYNNQSLMGYDGADAGAGGALYIDSSSLEGGGGLDNMILTIGGTQPQAQAETAWMPSTSQDILAAALANTDVFQTETTMQDEPCVVDTSSLLASIPSTLLLPSLNRSVTAAANVSETSLTLNQPIMSPLEVGSSFPAPPAVSTPPPPYEAVTEPAFHPSMPLLSEEPVEQQVAFETNGTEAFHAEAETAFEPLSFDGKGEVPTEGAEFVVEEEAAGEATFDTSLLTTSSEMMPFLAEGAAPGLPQSMPLLCDDAVPEQSQDSQASTLSETTFE